MQIYVPVTLAMLQQLVAEGSLWPVNGTAFAVTPRLREAYVEGDDDELGEVALREAALASLRLLAAADASEQPGAKLPPRRAVVVADVGDVTLRPDLDDAVVIALRDMIKLICARRGISREDAYTLCSLAADLRVTQVVNGTKGIHVMLEKALLSR